MASTTVRDNVAIAEPDLLIAAPVFNPNQPQSPYPNPSASVATNLGAYATSGDGRGYRFVYDGGTALVAGALYQSPVQTTSIEGIGFTATSVGDTSVTTGSTVTLVADVLAGGFLVIRKGLGKGNVYSIRSNTAATGAVTTLTLSDPIRVATDTTSIIDLYYNPYNGVVINPTTATAAPVGVAIIATSGTQYAWLQTEGTALVQNDNAVTINPGNSVYASTATAGAVSGTTVGLTIPYQIGVALTTISGTNYGLVKLDLN